MSEPPVPPEMPASDPSSVVPPPPGADEAAHPARPGPIGTPADFLRTIQQTVHADPAAPTEPPPPLLGAEQPRETHPFLYHGEAREYFRIWIVNTLLTIVTLGLYAAWAKVRKRRYLRGNTELMGHRFDYVADPRRILIGNVLVALMFVAYMVVGEVYPGVRLAAIAAGVVLLPWVVVRSLAFNAHNTVYRGMRFYSRQTYGMAALTFLGQWVAIIVTLGFYYPAWVRNRKEFVITGHRLGDAFFRFESKSGPFYAAYLVSGAIILGAVMAGSAITALLLAGKTGRPPTPVQLIPFFVLYGLALFLSKQYVYARLFNHIWSHTRLDNHRFIANLSTGAWLKLQFVNLGAIIGTAGLLYPWAVVRSTRYALQSLRFAPDRPIEKIGRLTRRDGSALGETAAEFVGLDFGL